ncbi:hypothetical protein ACFLTD_00810, partial [Elusimicrobiota bacterium]
IYDTTRPQSGNSTILPGSFKYDITEPTSTITLPLDLTHHNDLNQVSGDSYDETADIEKVQVLIYNVNDEDYWNGADWFSSSDNWQDASGDPFPAWIYDSGAVTWEDGDTYTIQSRGIDQATDINDLNPNIESPSAGIQIICDKNDPGSIVEFPDDGQRVSALAVIKGTSTDRAPGEVVGVKMSIFKQGVNVYWNENLSGNGDWQDNPYWNTCITTGNYSYWTWTPSTYTWSSGIIYRLNTIATDKAGNPELNFATATFTYDTFAPASYIEDPSHNQSLNSLNLISGTADSDTANVKIRIRREDNYYWNWGGAGGSWIFNDNSLWANTAGSTNWSKDVSFVTWDSGYNYLVQTIAIDNSQPQNWESPGTSGDDNSHEFFFDQDPPYAETTFPVHMEHYTAGQISQIAGTSQDDFSDVLQVELSILKESTTRWFTGTAFTNPAEDWKLAQGSYTWTYSPGPLPGSLEDGEIYMVRIRPEDSLNNVGISTFTSRFIYDTTRPQSGVDVPADAGIYDDTLSLLYGTASDDAPGIVDQVDISIRVIDYPSDGQSRYWSGSTWTAVAEQWHTVSQPWTAWTYTGISGDKWVTGKDYEIRVRATDRAGNEETAITSNQFQVVLQASEFIVTGINSGEVAGSFHTVKVEVKDKYGNPALTYGGTIKFTTKDEYNLFGHPASEKSESTINTGEAIPTEYKFTTSEAVPGEHTFNNLIFYRQAGADRFLVVYDTYSVTVPAPDIQGEQSGILVDPATPVKLQVIIPGENAAPGTTAGKTGGPNSYPAGGTFYPTINICDTYWNITDATDTVSVTTTDPNDANPGNVYFQGSTVTAVEMVTAGSRYVEANSSLYTDFLQAHPSNNAITIYPGDPDRLQIVMPGESAAAGTVNGKTGSPTPQSAGSQFTVTVNVCDTKWNINTSTTVWAEITTSDIYAVEPSSEALAGGTFPFLLTMTVAGTQTVTANCLDNPGLLQDQQNFEVLYGSGTKLQVLVPGESRKPGPGSGKQGTPDIQVAGDEFTVTVNLCDDVWNVITDTQVFVNVTTSDGYGTVAVPGKSITGNGTFRITNKTAWFAAVRATHTVTATASGWTASKSSEIELDPNSGVKLQVLVPGENPDPGSPTGKQDPADIQVAGSSFTVTVRAVDDYWNIQKSSNPVVVVSATDGDYQAQGQQSLSNGKAQFWVTLNDATNDPWQVIASTGAGEDLSADISSNITVNAGTAVKLQVLLPGENADPGSASGKSGSPTARTAGSKFNVTVNCTDSKWNRVITANPDVKLKTDNNYSELPLTQPLIGGTTTFGVILYTAENTIINAYDDAGVPQYSTGTSAMFGVNPAAANRLQILVTGEDPEPGNWSGAPTGQAPFGKTAASSPDDQTAGIPFDATVNIVDRYYNVKPDVAPSVGVTVTTDDNYDTEPSSKTLMNGTTTFEIDLRTAKTTVINAEDTDLVGSYYGSVDSPGITVDPNNPSKLLVICEGETHAPGDEADGKSDNTPDNQVSGAEFTVTVYITDQYYNVTSSTSPEVSITLEDTNSVPPSNRTLINGTTTFPVTFVTMSSAGQWYVRADDVSSTYQAYTTPDITVGAGTATKLLVILPGESPDPGTATGKQGSPDTQTAGTEFSITVQGVDDNWNMNTAVNATVHIDTQDPYDSDPAPFNDRDLVSGQTKFGITLLRASSCWIKASTTAASATSLIDYTTVGVNVDPGTFSRLLVMADGESALPGSPTGKQGAPDDQIAGQQFSIVIRGTDDYFNMVNTATAPVNITTEDPNDGVDFNENLDTGDVTTYVTMITSGTWQIYTRAVGAAWDHIAWSTSTAVNVGADRATKLQVLFPGETNAPGTASGKNGPPDDQTAGAVFTVTVNAVDDNWNVDRSTSFEVNVTASDPNAGININRTLITGTRNIDITLVTASTHTLSVTDNRGIVTGYTTPDPVTVNFSSATKLLVLLPGQSHEPGDTGSFGKSGSPDLQAAGNQFTVTVMACDNWFNLNSSTNAVVDLHTSDSNHADPYDTRALVSGQQTFPVTYFKAEDNAVIEASNIKMSTGTSSNFTVNAGTATKLIVIVPGEFYVAGSTVGKSGVPDVQNAGVVFTVTVRSVDQYYNTDETVSSNVGIETSDVNDVDPLPKSLVSGYNTFDITMVTAGTHTVTSTDYETSLSSDTSSVIQVAAGAPVQYQVLVPNEVNVPGTGKSGTVADQTAGVAFTVTVNACDGGWNVVTSTSVNATLTTTDPYDSEPALKTLSAGSTYFVISPVTAMSNLTITASGDLTNPDTSSDINVDPNVPLKLIVLAPGENHEPGNWAGSPNRTQPYGKTSGSSPIDQTAGVEFTLTVHACDNYWNVTDTAPAVGITATDINAVLPSTAALVNGSGIFDITFRTANSTWTAAATSPGYGPYTSAQIDTNPGVPVKLQVIVPGENESPGTGSGKTGTPDVQVAGSTFTVTVNAVDSLFNVNHSTDFIVSIVTSDPYDTHPDNKSLINGTASFDIVFIKADTHTITANPVDSSVLSGVSAGVEVDADVADRLIVLVPGVSPVQGDKANNGRSGNPDSQYAGIQFTVTVRATDRFYNRRLDADNIVRIYSEDPATSGAPYDPASAALAQGEHIFDPGGGTGLAMISKNLTGWEIYVSTDDGTSLAMDISQPVPLLAGAAQNLQALIHPDEWNDPAMPAGKNGSPDVQTAGTDFTVRVNLTDQYWNIKENPVPNPVVSLTSSDPFADMPTDRNLTSGGYRDFVFPLVTAGSWEIYVEDTGAMFATSTTSVVNVNPGAAGRIQVLLPGETALAGNADEPECTGTQAPYGKTTDTPDTQTAGEQFTITVNITDKYWNITNTADTIDSIVTSDQYDTDPGSLVITGGSSTDTVTIFTAQPSTITASDTVYFDYTSALFSVDPNIPAGLRVLVPGISADPGNLGANGRSGSASIQTAGAGFTVTVQAVDSWWNLNPAATNTVTLGTTDPNDTHPQDLVMSSGYTAFVATMVTVGFYKVTSSDTHPTSPLTSDTSVNVEVQVGSPQILQILPPGVSNAPGTVSGRSGTPDPQVAGVEFTVTLNLCDDYWNISNADSPLVQITTNDQYADDYGFLPSTVTLAAGTATADVTLVTARNNMTTLTLSDLSGRIPPYTPNTSQTINVTANTQSQLRILVPGMNEDLGSLSSGKSGTPDIQTAGATFVANLQACDDYWNVAYSTDNVHIEIEDPYAVPVATGRLSLGERTEDITSKTAGNWQITLTDADAWNGLMNQQVSTQFTVTASTLTRLLVRLPGESHIPGSPTGRTGTANIWSVASAYDIEVIATDDYFNKVATNTLVHITSTDPQATLPLVDRQLVNGSRMFSVQLKTVQVGGVDDNNFVFAEAAAPYALAMATSTEITVNPGVCASLEVKDITDNTAGLVNDVTVTALDAFGNVADGGTVPNNAYQGEIEFSANQDASWDGSPEIPGNGLPDDYTFTTVNEGYGDQAGTAFFSNGVTLRMAGTRWVRAEDKFNGLIWGRQENIIISAGIVTKFTVLANNSLDPIDVPAGDVAEIRAYATDNYFNATSLGADNLDVTISTFNIVFTTMTLGGNPNDGNSINPQNTTTDSSGTVSGIWYTVSRVATDRAVINVSASTVSISGQSPWITTVGGGADFLEFASGNSNFTAGDTPEPTEPYIVKRRDIYGNLAETGVTIVDIVTDSGSPNTASPSTKPRHRFLDDLGGSLPDSNSNSKQDVTIANGQTEAEFFYYEQMASWDEISHDTHTLLIDAGLVGAGDPAAPVGDDIFAVTVDPKAVAKIDFITPPRTLQAGTTSQVMTIHTRDEYGNDKPVSKNEILDLDSDSAWCAFITNQGTFRYSGGSWSPSDPTILLTTGTYSSDFYYSDNVRGTPRIDLHGTGTPGINWGAGQQYQTIDPGPIDHLAFINAEYTAGNPLIAGATSWAITVQTQDMFDNPAEVSLNEQINLFLTGANDPDYDFSLSSSVWTETDNVIITTNTATASFYLQVYKVPPSGMWQMRAERAAGGWSMGLQDVVVRGGTIEQVVFVTPPRNIVVGHNDYATYGSTSYVIIVNTQDKYGNISDVTETSAILLSANGGNPSFSQDLVVWGAPSVSISSGNYSASFYFTDSIRGQRTIYATEATGLKGWTRGEQQANVYPSDASAFSITHDGLATVYLAEPINIKAIDSNGNFADGHPDPYDPYGSTDTWTYYVGVASITPSSVGHPAGLEPSIDVGYVWDFQQSLDAGNPGQVQVLLTDTIVSDPPDVPTIVVTVRDDNAMPVIYGQSQPLWVTGAIVKPYEDPISGDRVGPDSIYQDAKNVLMERFDIYTMPAVVQSTGNWKKLRVNLEGSADEGDIPVVRLWKDNGDGQFSHPDYGYPNNGNGSSTDIFLDSAPFTNQAGIVWTELEVDNVLGYFQMISHVPSYYFITVDCDYFADAGDTVRLYWEKNYFGDSGAGYWDPVGSQVANNNFNIETPTATIVVTPGDVIMQSYSLMAASGTVTQGDSGPNIVGALRMDMFTTKYTIDWSEVRISLIGTGVLDTDISNVRIYKDQNANQTFEPLADQLISVGDDMFGTQIPNVAIVKIRDPADLDVLRPQVINTSTQTYFVAISIDDSATIGATVGISVDSED